MQDAIFMLCGLCGLFLASCLHRVTRSTAEEFCRAFKMVCEARLRVERMGFDGDSGGC